MNKEEIEKAKQCLNEIIQNTYAEGKAKKLDTLRKYINELEQKEFILDEVTDKLKEDTREEEGYIKRLDERTKEIVQPKKTIIIKSDYARSILKIIEGEKK